LPNTIAKAKTSVKAKADANPVTTVAKAKTPAKARVGARLTDLKANFRVLTEAVTF